MASLSRRWLRAAAAKALWFSTAWPSRCECRRSDRCDNRRELMNTVRFKMVVDVLFGSLATATSAFCGVRSYLISGHATVTA